MGPSIIPAHWYDILFRVMVICTILHSALPPWEFLSDFPIAQKYYKLLVYLIGYAAGNVRSSIWSVLSTANGTKTSEAANGNGKKSVQSPIDPEKK